jgi:serine/threonine protein kinase
MSMKREVSISPGNILEIVLLEDFEVDKKIGSGSFGYVFLAKHKPTGKQFALKQLSKNELVQKRQLKYALTEL